MSRARLLRARAARVFCGFSHPAAAEPPSIAPGCVESRRPVREMRDAAARRRADWPAALARRQM